MNTLSGWLRTLATEVEKGRFDLTMTDQDEIAQIRLAADEIERLHMALANVRNAMLTVDGLLAHAGYAENASARHMLACARPSVQPS